MQISENFKFWEKKNIVSEERSEYLPNFEQKYQKAKLEMKIRKVLYHISDNLRPEELEKIIKEETNKMNYSLDEESTNYLRNIANSIEVRKRQVKEILVDVTIMNSLYPNFSFFKDVQIKNHCIILKNLNFACLFFEIVACTDKNRPIVFLALSNESLLIHELEHIEFRDIYNLNINYNLENIWEDLKNKNWQNFQTKLQYQINNILETKVKTEILAFFIQGKSNQNISSEYDPIHFGPIKQDFYNFLKKSNLTRSEKVFAESKFWQIYSKRYDEVGLCWQAMQNLKRKGIERENMSALMRDLPPKDWCKFVKNANLTKIEKIVLDEK